MDLYRPAASIGLAVGLLLMLTACPGQTEDAEPPETAEATAETGESADSTTPPEETAEGESESEEPQVSFHRAATHPVVLRIRKTEESDTGSSADEVSDVSRCGELQDAPACELAALPRRAAIRCTPTDSPLVYTEVRWSVVVPPGQDPGIEEVCIDATAENQNPDVFPVPIRIDTKSHNSVEVPPDCRGISAGEEVAWPYRVTALDGDGQVLCAINPPEIHVKKGG